MDMEHDFCQRWRIASRKKRYELFTSTRSVDNIRLYQRNGYKEFDRKAVNNELIFVFMEKPSET